MKSAGGGVAVDRGATSSAPGPRVGRRLYCRGTAERPCPGRVWFYYAGRGRPPLRCHLCGPLEKRRRKLEDDRDYRKRMRALIESARVEKLNEIDTPSQSAAENLTAAR